MTIEQVPYVMIAAGRSSRMGCPKGLLRYKSRYWLEEQLSRIRSAGFHTIVLVFGRNQEQYLSNILFMEDALVTSHCREELGPVYSIQHAVRFLSNRSINRGIFLSHVDRPVPSSNFFKTLSKEIDFSMIVRPTFKKKAGHPVFLCNDFCQSLSTREITEECRLDHLIKNSNQLLKEVNVSNREVSINFNTIEQWQSFLKLEGEEQL